MFSFHKPRVYRSVEGCCICRAKSSSSRFSDSRKYESDAMNCFALKYPRHGEICNACVLLVKRFKRLPVDSTRRWGHVVDARAGPGTKSQTKSKRYRDSTDDNPQSTSSTSASSARATGSTNGNKRGSSSSSGTSTGGGSTKSAITEKFTKIFKKNKNKSSASAPIAPVSVGKTDAAKRIKVEVAGAAGAGGANVAWTRNHSLSTTPDSLDSDYEESRFVAASAVAGASGVVQFQTQTRASFKSRNNAAVLAINEAVANAAAAAAAAATVGLTVSRKRPMQLGSKRRRRLPPRKNRRVPEHENATASSFIDDMEWQEVKSCCGMVYECATLGGAILIDMQHYKPCEQKHPLSEISIRRPNDTLPSAEAAGPSVPLTQPPPDVAATMQTAAPSAAPGSPTAPAWQLPLAIETKPTPTTVTASSAMPTSTPVLKKHHLFFKRQSEMFPQPDATTTTSSVATATIKTDPTTVAQTLVAAIETEHSTTTNAIFPLKAESTSSAPGGASGSAHAIAGGLYGGGVANIGARHSAVSSKLATLTPIQLSSVSSNNIPLCSASFLGNNTVPVSLTAASASTLSASNDLKPQGFLHKIKAHDIGKVVKQSAEKFTSSVRLKANDLNDMKHLMKSMDRSYVMAKPSPSLGQANHVVHLQQQQQVPIPLTSATLTSSTGSSPTSATKFSDNSSDSGFDENMLERKSASPLQEDNERKMQTRPGVQTMFLASGVQIQGQQQNLVLTGNEVAAKILQNRKQQAALSVHQPHNNRSQSTIAIKIAQLLDNCSPVGEGARARAIYNNNNMIQHENGVTTIVPASSLAATTQTAAMNALAPSTVTITPAPPPPAQTDATDSAMMAAAVAASMMPRPNSLTTRRVNTTQHLASANNGHHHMGNVVIGGAHLSAINPNASVGVATSTTAIASSANQKIILLKAPTKYGSGHPNGTNSGMQHTTSTTTATSMSLSAATGVGIGIGRQQQGYQQQQSRH